VRPLTFLSDYGTADEFAGVVHAVIARIAPGAHVVDLTHGIPRQDVAAGALTLARTLPFAAPGVHLAVVDPGVGGRRRAVALRTAAEERLLVGPDNGLLIPAAERFGGVAEAVEISASPWRLEPVSATFHGRDVFAPVAARLALGEPLAAAGEPLAPAELVPLELPRPQVADGTLTATVAAVDVFGNVVLHAGASDLAAAGLAAGARVLVRALASHAATVAGTFADVPDGDALVYVDAAELVAVAINGGDAAAMLGVAPGGELAIAAADA